MKVKCIKIFASICIASGIVSILLQFVAITVAIMRNKSPDNLPSDTVGYWIWAGVQVLYLTAGSLALAVTNTKSKRLLVALVVVSFVSIFTSLVTTVLSAGTAAFGGYSFCSWPLGYTTCYVWKGVEWTVVACSILAFISSLALVILASESLCTCCRKHELRDPFSYVDATSDGERMARHQLDFGDDLPLEHLTKHNTLDTPTKRLHES